MKTFNVELKCLLLDLPLSSILKFVFLISERNNSKLGKSIYLSIHFHGDNRSNSVSLIQQPITFLFLGEVRGEEVVWGVILDASTIIFWEAVKF